MSSKGNHSVPQVSKLSLSVFSFYIADIARPTSPVKRVYYADELIVWAIGVNIPDLEVSLNGNLEEMTEYLKDNSLLISSPKSSVTRLTPDPYHVKTHPRILIEDSQLPLVQIPKILGVYLDTMGKTLRTNHTGEFIGSQDSGTGTQHQQLPDKDVLFPIT